MSTTGWWEKTTYLKNMLVKLEIFPNFRGEHKKNELPPPRQEFIAPNWNIQEKNHA